MTGAPIAIELSGMPSVARDSANPVRIVVRNISAEPVWLVGVVDGAEAGARFPHWRATVTGPDGPLPPREASGSARPLLPVDFRLLAPGATTDPTDRADGANYFPIAAFQSITDRPGRYRASLELDTRAPDDAAWLGDTGIDRRPAAAADRAEAGRRLREVPRLTVRSNEIEVVVE